MNTHFNRVRTPQPKWTIVLLVSAIAVSASERAAEAAPREQNALTLMHRQHNQLNEKFRAEVEQLAQQCEKNGLIEAAQELRLHAAPIETPLLSVELLPSQVRPEIPQSLLGPERAVRIQLRNLQRELAKKLYLLSRKVLYGGSATFAYRLLRETAHHDPDHKAARRLLGFVRHGNEWVTPFEAKMSREKNIWHDSFGWLPKNHVERYEQGQRYFNRRWITSAQEAEIRRDFRHAWEVRTEHYLVKTNHSLERGVEIARKLEDFHDFFTQAFAAFFSSPEQLQKLFQGSSRAGRPMVKADPYEVHYYRTQAEYNRRLISKIPLIEVTNGLYYTTDRIAYFFFNETVEGDATLYHEATHQLLYESSGRDRSIGETNNFWIIEGIACYMESFENRGGQFRVGDPDYDRFVAARYRFLVDGYHVPLGQLSQMSMLEFQNDSINLSKNYSLASGLAHFFMHYNNGKYRDALIEHLSQLYDENPRVRRGTRSLEQLTGVAFSELDDQYGKYLKSLDAKHQSDLIPAD